MRRRRKFNIFVCFKKKKKEIGNIFYINSIKDKSQRFFSIVLYFIYSICSDWCCKLFRVGVGWEDEAENFESFIQKVNIFLWLIFFLVKLFTMRVMKDEKNVEPRLGVLWLVLNLQEGSIYPGRRAFILFDLVAVGWPNEECECEHGNSGRSGQYE